jgi:signal transduction histidine kinase
MGVSRDLFGRRKDGSEFPVEVGLNSIRTGGEHALVLAVVIDISERKRLERLKEEFVATVSHELRTPLTSTAGSLGLLADQMTEAMPESHKKLVKIAQANSERLVRLINDILDMEKIESGRVRSRPSLYQTRAGRRRLRKTHIRAVVSTSMLESLHVRLFPMPTACARRVRRTSLQHKNHARLTFGPARRLDCGWAHSDTHGDQRACELRALSFRPNREVALMLPRTARRSPRSWV